MDYSASRESNQVTDFKELLAPALFTAIILVIAVGACRAVSRPSTAPVETAQRIAKVWAGQGPFRDGEMSAIAFRAAAEVVMGKDWAQINNDERVMNEHREAYDSDPAAWEEAMQVGQRDSDGEIRRLVDEAREVGLELVLASTVKMFSDAGLPEELIEKLMLGDPSSDEPSTFEKIVQLKKEERIEREESPE
jgi:hypothetical protein